MNRYDAPVREMRFVLHDVLNIEYQLKDCAGTPPQREVADAVLEEAARFSGEVLAPLNAVGDAEGCEFDKRDGSVRTPQGFRAAYAQFIEGGWSGLTAPEAWGGQHLPEVLGAAVKEMIDSANLAWGTYPLLSHGATEALKHHGEDWQREVFLRPIVDGTWTGTMCLTEPHAGSDLGMLRTRAEPAADGSFNVYGTKIFITAGEHDLTDNIIHLVLARLPDAPAGVKGISLFIVPKFRVARDGSVGERNTVQCGAIEHKMGLRGSSTCVMNFDGANGYLIGEPNRGLQAMFTMMNTARLAVGLQGLGLSERALQNSLRYAHERLQMRALSGPRAPQLPADPIIVHPDIRRMLLTQKSLVEAGRVLVYDACLQIDLSEKHPDPAQRALAEARSTFLTPIVKAFLTEASVECTYHALQIFGGHGYIAEWGMEQLARDARITTIYEGTTQIQALDLLGRKVLANQGQELRRWLGEVEAACVQADASPSQAGFAESLRISARHLSEASARVAAVSRDNADEVGAAAYDFLMLASYVALGWCWLRMLAAANAGAEHASAADKYATADFFFARILPRAAMHAECMRSGVRSLDAAGAALTLQDWTT